VAANASATGYLAWVLRFFWAVLANAEPEHPEGLAWALLPFWVVLAAAEPGHPGEFPWARFEPAEQFAAHN